MKMIAYKRADNPNSKVRDALPEDFITEWRYLEPGEQPDANEGWRTLPEDQFQQLINDKNIHSRIDKFMKDRQDAADAEAAERVKRGNRP